MDKLEINEDGEVLKTRLVLGNSHGLKVYRSSLTHQTLSALTTLMSEFSMIRSTTYTHYIDIDFND